MVSGESEAASQDELRPLLRREQIVVTQASEKGREIAIPKLGRNKKVKAKELAIFTRQFSVMIDAGLPLVQCIDILARAAAEHFFQRRFAPSSAERRRRRDLHAAMQNIRKFSTVFTRIWSKPAKRAVCSI